MRLLASALLPTMAEVIMRVLARIQIVGAVVMSITAALVLFGTFWLVSFFDVFPEIHSRWVVGALLSGLPLLSFLCLVLALSIDAQSLFVNLRREPIVENSRAATERDSSAL